MREGICRDVGFGSATRSYFLKVDGDGGNVPTGNANTGPISFTSYPMETVEVHPPVSPVHGVFDGINVRPCRHHEAEILPIDHHLRPAHSRRQAE